MGWEDAGVGEVTDEARGALRVGDGTRVLSLLASVEPTGEVLELRGAASFILLDFARALEDMEGAYAAYRAESNGAGCVRTARMLGGMHGSTSGDWAVANGWITRAKNLASELPDDREVGWVMLTQGMFEPQRDQKNRAFERALELGRTTGDPNLAFAASAYLGASRVHEDSTEDGMVLLDEALVAVIGGEVDDFIVIEEIFCQMFSACEHARDVARAEQWIRVGEQVAERRRLPAVSAYCRTHYGGILTAAGRWDEADATLTEAVKLWALGKRTLKASALARLADLRVRQGRYDEAERLLDGLADHRDAVAPLAALHLAQGRFELSKELVGRALASEERTSSTCVPLLGLLIEAQAACGEDMTEALARMTACVQAHPSAYATGALALARSRAGIDEPRTCLREALDGFTRAQLPLEAALCRLALAESYRDDAPQVATSEARAALGEFERLRAARGTDSAAAFLRQMGERVAPPRPTGGSLTVREREILGLLGDGLSNPEIALRLFISRKTVEHHVSNILTKLALPNRAAAAAFAVMHEPAEG